MKSELDLKKQMMRDCPSCGRPTSLMWCQDCACPWFRNGVRCGGPKNHSSDHQFADGDVARIKELQAKLATVEAARDQLASIAEARVHPEMDPGFDVTIRRINELRKAGS